MTSQATSQRFKALCHRNGVPEAEAAQAWTEVALRYAEPHRSYHNLSHIDRMLRWFDASNAADDGMELAIWYHDVIYVPLDPQNEAQSAQFFLDAWEGFLDPASAVRVVRLILATNPAQARSDLLDEAQVVDIDLSILGSAPDEYDVYCRAIRKEYAVVPDAVFRPGRRALLEKFLSQPVYATEFFRDRLEKQARENLEREWKSLGMGG